MKDALNNEIVLGKVYGYSQRQNGVVMVTIGEALKFNKDSVTLEVLHKGIAVYATELKSTDFPKSGKVSVISNTLFELNKGTLGSFKGFKGGEE